MQEADITLLICTHDNADQLGRALAAIADQRVPAGARWEVLVIDNNCTDHTREVVERFQSDPRIPALRLERETTQGVGYARKTGLRLAAGHLVGFVDDDCLLDPDWVAEALAFADAHPRAGAVGSHVRLRWEVPPPEYCQQYGESLARQEFGDSPVRLPDRGRQIPCGAGLLLRRRAVLESGYPTRGILQGRDPRRLGAGEDAEVAFFVRNAGYEVWLNPAMRVQHHIPPWRTELPYLRRLHRGFGRAESHLRLLAMHTTPDLLPRVREVGSALGELRRVAARYRAVYRQLPDQRPSLAIGLAYAVGYLEGSLWRLLTGHRA